MGVGRVWRNHPTETRNAVRSAAYALIEQELPVDGELRRMLQALRDEHFAAMELVATFQPGFQVPEPQSLKVVE